jgi:hypothetical protein
MDDMITAVLEGKGVWDAGGQIRLKDFVHLSCIS